MSAPDNIGRKGTPGGATGIPALTSESQAPLCDEFGRLIVVIDGIVASEGGSGGGSGAILSDAAPANVDAGTAAPGVGLAASRDDHKHDVVTAAAVGLTLASTNAEGSANALARADHTHAITGVLADIPPTAIAVLPQSAGDDPTASRSDHAHAVVTATAVGLSLSSPNAEGVSAALARADHTHAISGVLGSTTPVQVNAGAAAVGVATSASHADHKHSVQVAPPIDLTLTTVNAEGTSVALARADHAHAITGVITTNPASTLAAGDAAAVGAGLLAARDDHKHGVPVNAPIALVVGGANVTGTAVELVRADHKHALPAFGTGPGTFCEGNDARLSALGSLAVPSGNPYIDPPLVADSFDDEFSSGSADLSARGWTISTSNGTVLTRAGDIQPWHATGPTGNTYWSTILGSQIFIQGPYGVSIFIYKAVSLAAGDTYFIRVGGMHNVAASIESGYQEIAFYSAFPPLDVNNRVSIVTFDQSTGAETVHFNRTTGGSIQETKLSPFGGSVNDIHGLRWDSGTNYSVFVTNSHAGETLSRQLTGAINGSAVTKFSISMNMPSAAGMVPALLCLDYVRKKTANAWIASAPRPVAWNTVDANFANYTVKAAPVLNDTIVEADSGASGALKQSTFAAVLGLVAPNINGFRLSTSNTSSISTNGTYSTIYLTPHISQLIGLYTSSAWQLYQAPASPSLALSGMVAGTPADVFAYASGGAVALESINWSSAMIRATSIVQTDGVWTKTGDKTRRYLGTILPSSATQIIWQDSPIDAAGSIPIWNVANQVQASIVWQTAIASFTHTASNSLMYWNNNSNICCIKIVLGLSMGVLTVDLQGTVDGKGALSTLYLELTSGNIPGNVKNTAPTVLPAGQRVMTRSYFAGRPALGYNIFSVMTFSAGSTAVFTGTGDPLGMSAIFQC